MVQTRASSKRSMYKPAKPLQFNDLPTELRLMVWRYIVKQRGDFFIEAAPQYTEDGSLEVFESRNNDRYGGDGSVEGTDTKTALSLFSVNRQYAAEVKELFWGKNCFTFCLLVLGKEAAHALQARQALKWTLPVDFCLHVKAINLDIHGTVWKEEADYKAARHIITALSNALAGRDPNDPKKVLITGTLPQIESIDFFDNDWLGEMGHHKSSIVHLFEPMIVIAKRRVASFFVHVNDGNGRATNLQGLLGLEDSDREFGQLRRVLKEGIQLKKAVNRNTAHWARFEPLYDWNRVKPSKE